MMKKPTTKKLPEKQVARTVTAKGKPFMKLFSDEDVYKRQIQRCHNLVSLTKGENEHDLRIL